MGIVLLVAALGLSGATVWLAFSNFDAYRELGPAGRRAPCGSAFRPLAGYENDEVCFDVAQSRQYGVLALIGTGVPLLVIGGLLLRPRPEALTGSLAASSTSQLR